MDDMMDTPREMSAPRHADTMNGPPLRILSLDGGGVRGYSMFIIIQEIMHRTFVEIEGRAPRRDEIPKPADHFDLIVGTGTGGLIALMLGRLRLDIETCKELYTKMTRKVFQTDKTILGIPTRPTLFKASMLESAIQEAVAEHTRSGSEGNDGSEVLFSPTSSGLRSKPSQLRRRASRNESVISFSARSPTKQNTRDSFASFGSIGGDPDAMLYDEREARTKTAVTAVYKGASARAPAVLLRSYDSRKEATEENDCKIWEAGRATCSIGLAFKPIRIGQSVFHDDGEGRFNPSPEALDEAVVNEWPGREVGVFLSVGTGRRPKGSEINQAEWYEGFLGAYAEAKQRLMSKIEGCEKTHEYFKNERLAKRGVNVDNYYRLNVEVGVGEFGMNEWNRLAEISQSTKLYLKRKQEQNMVQDASTKLAKIHLAYRRPQRPAIVPDLSTPKPDLISPLAVELPADMPGSWPAPIRSKSPPNRQSYDSGVEDLSHEIIHTPSPRASYEHQNHTDPRRRAATPPRAGLPAAANSPHHSNAHPGIAPNRPRQSSVPPYMDSSSPAAPTQPYRGRQISGPTPTTSSAEDDRLMILAPTPSQYRKGSHNQYPNQQHINNATNRKPAPQPHRVEPPPLPPKTPLPERQQQQQQQYEVNGGGRRRGNSLGPARTSSGMGMPPYPMDEVEAPPPVINMARKPEYRGGR